MYSTLSRYSRGGRLQQLETGRDMAAETKGQEAQDVEMSESGKGPEPGIGQVRCQSLPVLSETIPSSLGLRNLSPHCAKRSG